MILREGTVESLPGTPGHGQIVLPPAAVDLAPSSQVRTLYRLGDPALSELGLEEFLAELLIRVREALSVDTVAILLFDEATNELVARAANGLEEEVEQGVRLPIGQGFAGRIAAERVAIFIADVDHADILNPILRETGIRSLLGVPLIVQGDLIGVLHVGSLSPRAFGARDLAVLQIAAGRAAPGIERARLYSALGRGCLRASGSSCADGCAPAERGPRRSPRSRLPPARRARTRSSTPTLPRPPSSASERTRSAAG
jgi:signal transduction protein with GAF and PtsI domain